MSGVSGAWLGVRVHVEGSWCMARGQGACLGFGLHG